MKVGWRSPAVGWSTDDCCGWILREVGVSVVRVGSQVDGLSGAAAERCGTVRVGGGGRRTASPGGAVVFGMAVMPMPVATSVAAAAVMIRLAPAFVMVARLL